MIKRRAKMKFVFVLAMFFYSAALFPFPLPERSLPEQKSQETPAVKVSERGQVEVTSRIDRVVVYPDRAQVIRRGEANISPETSAIIFRGLPGTVIPDSVRVVARSQSPVRISGVEIKHEFLEAEQLPEVKKLMEEIKAVETEISRLYGQEKIYEAQEKFLDSLGTALSGQMAKDLLAGRPDPVSVDKFIDYLGNRLQIIKKNLLENYGNRNEQQSRLEALKKKLKEIMPQSSREQYDVYVLVETSHSTGLQVELSYIVSQAGWQPVYVFKALPESGEIEIGLASLVRQKTGENWKDVNLVLSTSRPTAGSQPGELSPWYLDFSQPRLLRAPVSRELAKSDMVMAEEAAAALVMEEKPEAVETWLGVNFEVRKPWTVLSDGVERRVPVEAIKVPCGFDYFAVPKLQELAFLRASFKNSLPFPLLPGKADLFIGQEFAGSMSLDLIPAGDELRLYFGEDRQVKVKRELVKREKSGPGFLGKNEKISLAFRVTLENLRSRPVEVEIQDQIPVSQNTKIEVKDVRIVPAPAGRDEKGILTWKIKLNPGQKQEIILEFSVEYPKDSRIIGL